MTVSVLGHTPQIPLILFIKLELENKEGFFLHLPQEMKLFISDIMGLIPETRRGIKLTPILNLK